MGDVAKLPHLTIIAHFFNEEYLLPWWLSHHVALADDGILIDYGSTDRSVDICRRLAPGWRIVRSRNHFFDARAADLEVMDIERSIDGWKLALNVTEFLCVDLEEALCELLEGQGERGYGLRGVCMVDPPGVYATDPSYDRPLLAQRTYGYYEEAVRSPIVGLNHLSRSRLLHNYPHGDYGVGRHSSLRSSTMHPPGATIRWFGFSPWNDAVIKRKLQIVGKIPEVDAQRGLGVHHKSKLNDLLADYAQVSRHAFDLGAPGSGAHSPDRHGPSDLSPLSGLDIAGLRLSRGTRPLLHV
jgi:hypothetical protein